jgi:hypothetical protein
MGTPTVTGTPTATPTPPYVGRLYLPQVLAGWSSYSRASPAALVQLPPYLPVALRSDGHQEGSDSP